MLALSEAEIKNSNAEHESLDKKKIPDSELKHFIFSFKQKCFFMEILMTRFYYNKFCCGNYLIWREGIKPKKHK